MAEEIDESAFYRQDFSTVSDWEIFNAQLGEVFQKLFINGEEYSGPVGTSVVFPSAYERRETLVLRNTQISIIYYFRGNLKLDDTNSSMYSDLMTAKNTFGQPLILGNLHDSHAISRMYGLSQFVVIAPQQSNHFSNPSEFCFFVSAATVAAAEYCIPVPIFVQIYDPNLNSFLGVGVNSTLRTNFDLVTLKQSPIEYQYLSGLLTLFKEKLPESCIHDVTVSVRHTYTLEKQQVHLPMSVPFFKPLSDNDVVKFDSKFLNSKKFVALPCGYFPDSSTDAYITCEWFDMSENIIDSPLHSELMSSKSTNCNMYQIVHAVSYLSSCLRDFSKLYCCYNQLDSFVSNNLTESFERTSIAFYQQHPGHNEMYSKTQKTQQTGRSMIGPLTENELKELLAYLLPDLYPALAKYYYTNDGEQKFELDPHRIKSSPLESLSSRISCLLATCNSHFGGKSGLVQMWEAFIRELELMLTIGLAIPGVTTGFPDTRTCLLNQKLQMLNYCIEQSKLQKCGNEAYKDTIEMCSENSPESGDDDENEFYECLEYVPEGRDRPLGDLKLLDYDEPLYIPITQDPVLKTEDELQADAESMLKFGSGSDLSKQLMCSSLHSDMEAFKAANPRAKFEDFIRWYSPKDWEEDEHSSSGKLSVRMQAPDNTWQKVWQEAQVVPASQQKRLFDAPSEALKVLSYLKSRKIGEIYDLAIISLLHAAILKFKDILQTADIFDIFETEIEDLLADLCRLSRDVDTCDKIGRSLDEKTPSTDYIISKLERLETNFYQFKCFEKLTFSSTGIPFTEIKQKFSDMIKNDNCCCIRYLQRTDEQMVESDNSEFINLRSDKELHKNLIIKEYILKLHGENVGPQFLRAIVTGEEVRLCGAFTENTTFI